MEGFEFVKEYELKFFLYFHNLPLMILTSSDSLIDRNKCI